MLTSKQIKKAVKINAVILDLEVPGWHDKISIEDLNMKDAVKSCIGAQLGWPYCTKCDLDDEESLIAFLWDGVAYGKADQIQHRWVIEISKRRRKKFFKWF